MRVAAVADLHAREGDRERLARLFAEVEHRADVLVLAGDLTHHGRPEEMATLLSVMRERRIPVVAVFGNHDHEFGALDELRNMMVAARVHLLDPGHVTIDAVGFAGGKGFAGGFGERLVRSFGEGALKAFVAESAIEAGAIKAELSALETRVRVAVLHYAPILETVAGEPPEIAAFLGTSRLAEALDETHASFAVHGHAHHGAPQGRTPGGVPVYNVALTVLAKAGLGTPYRVIET